MLLTLESLAAARVITMGFLLAAAWAFAGIRKRLAGSEDATLATAQLMFLPILFPYGFLLYTDVPSVALVLWMFRLSLDGRHATAGALGIAALGVRQTNVVWIGFIALFDWCAMRPSMRSGRAWLAAARRLWPYAVPVAAFVLFWLWRGKISMSQAQAPAHPDFSLHTGNLFFMLALAGLLFLPLMPTWLLRFVRAARLRPLWWLLPALLALLYATTFTADHPYNRIFPEYVLRNGVLMRVAEHGAAFVALGALATVAGTALCQVRWLRPAGALLVPVSALFVCASWLIEVRYYLIPFAFFNALRVFEDRRAETLMLLCWMPLSLLCLYGMLDFRFFL